MARAPNRVHLLALWKEWNVYCDRRKGNTCLADLPSLLYLRTFVVNTLTEVFLSFLDIPSSLLLSLMGFLLFLVERNHRIDYRSRRNVTLILFIKFFVFVNTSSYICLYLRAINNADFHFGFEPSLSLSSSKALADFKIMPQHSLE